MTGTQNLLSMVKDRLSEKRFLHTVSVAKCAVELSEFCGLDSKFEAEIASLLHDITKEFSFDEQMQIIRDKKIPLDKEDFDSVGVLHSFTAPFVIISDFPEYATEKVLSAVKNHTLGAPDMSVLDEIVFLSDFIEDTRTYEASVSLRQFVFSNMKKGQFSENILVLHKACVKAIDATVINLIKNNKPINSKNILTRNALLSKI